MMVIHAIWACDALQLWAEDSALPPQVPTGAGRSARQHPFAAAPDALSHALAGALAGTGTAEQHLKVPDDEITLLLPSTTGGPIASPELLLPPVEALQTSAARKVSLARWWLPVLVFSPAAATSLLAPLAELTPGEIVAGGSIGYLAAVARFADDLAARGRVQPVLAAEDGGYTARWRPVLSAADARYARELATAMPPACRAVSGTLRTPRGSTGDGIVTSAGPLLADMLDALADAAVRTRLQRAAGGGALLPARRGRRPARIEVAERMVVALTGEQPLIEVADARDERDVGELAAEFADWLESTALTGGSVRTCFRLVEPSADEGDALRGVRGVVPPGGASGGTEAWRVEFSLQSAEDPSLMLPAPDVWAGAGYGWLVGVLARHSGHPEEELLAGLGTAARMFPALDVALREPAPAQVALDTAGALEFLRETGPLLSAAGFGVLTPDWARKARLGLRLTTRSSSSGSSASGRQSLFGMEDLVDFRYDVALGDDVLTAEELAELAARKVPLVRVRGQWVELDDRHLTAALKFLERRQAGTMTAADVLGTVLGA
ncbi:MAG: SNF2 helicase-associated domain-containing protein, partial [Trebonia sp.]